MRVRAPAIVDFVRSVLLFLRQQAAAVLLACLRFDQDVHALQHPPPSAAGHLRGAAAQVSGLHERHTGSAGGRPCPTACGKPNFSSGGGRISSSRTKLKSCVCVSWTA